MGQKTGPILIIIALLLMALYSAFFTVDQTEQAILVQLGKPTGETIGAGLHIKIPFIQKVTYYENRLLDVDTPPIEILSADQKNLKIDYFAKWKIVDPLTFYETVRNVEGALMRLNSTIDSEIRMELGRYVMIDIISKPRSELMDAVKKRSNGLADNFGIAILDIRIKRIDLPQENQQAVYARMKTARHRQAMKYRAEGEGEAIRIKAAADRDRTILLSEARRKALTIEGQADAEAASIYAEAFKQDPEFFNLMRTLEASHKALNEKTVFVISPEHGLMRFMESSGADFGSD